MRQILFLAHRVPFPPDRGDKVRSYHLVRHLSERNDVHLLAFADDPRDLGHDAALASLCASHRIVWRGTSTARSALLAMVSGRPVSLAAFDTPAMRAAMAQMLAERRYDAIYVYSGQMAQYVPDGRSFVMDFVDVDSAKFAAYAGDAHGPMGWMMRREARLLAGFEQRVARRASASLFVSRAEADLFAARAAGANVCAIENGIDTDYFDPAGPFARIPKDGPLIVFTGQMDYRPNIDAVRWFAHHVLPGIRAPFRNARFAIVGRKPTDAVRALDGHDGVIVTDEVDDVRGWLAAADVVVAPLQIARGVQNKVLEAMAMARPVVATPAAAEGIDHDGTILVANGGPPMADRIVAILADPAAGSRIGHAARERVIARYGWDACLSPLDAVMTIDPQHGGADAA